jgi:hypothetical protein
MQTPSEKVYARRKAVLKHYYANREDLLAQDRAKYAADIEKSREYRKELYYKKRAERIAITVSWQKRNPEKVKLLRRRRLLREKYGMTLEEWNTMFSKQGKRCAICECKTVNGSRNWHVDHDHRTGRVRSILCNNCNQLLAGARDDAKNLRSAISYLERHSQIHLIVSP